MIKTYLIDGLPVMVTGRPRHHPTSYTLHVAGRPIAGSVEKTVLGSFLARDGSRRSLGTFSGLPRAVEQVVREERR
jgi:hypothetical protein